MKPPGDCRQGQKAVHVKEEPPEHSPPPPGGARSPSEPANAKTPVYLGDHRYVTSESPTELHIKNEPEETSLVHDVEEEAPCADEWELRSSGLHGVSAAAMLASLYTDHVVKDELLLGPELTHRPSVTPVFCEPDAYKPRVALDLSTWDHTYAFTGSAAGGGRVVSSDAAVAEAPGRRRSVRLERLLLDAERRACRVGRRTYRLRPESEPRRAATSATDTYRCNHCVKAFGHKLVLSKHIHPNLSTRLAHSRYSTREDSNLDRHQKLDTRTKSFRCSLKGNLQRLKSTHLGIESFHCTYCDYKCSHKGNLKRHEMIHTGVKPFQCNYCDYKCRRTSDLRCHEITHTGEKTFHSFQCNYCDYKCRQKGQLTNHEMTHAGVKPFQCKYCNFQCIRIESLRNHEMTHTIKPFQCTYCDYKFSRKGQLKRHVRTHTGEKPFQCNYCDYKCRRTSDLRCHEITHTGEKTFHSFQCNYCDYKCRQKGQLTNHEMTHAGVKPFQCKYCNFQCIRIESLRNHEMTHTIKPFQCTYCDYKFSRKGHLKRHVRTHTGEKPFQCDYCDHRCSREDHLRNHEMTHI